MTQLYLVLHTCRGAAGVRVPGRALRAPWLRQAPGPTRCDMMMINQTTKKHNKLIILVIVLVIICI